MPEESELNQNPLGAPDVPDLSEAIGKLMSHPEILEMAASVLGQSMSHPAEPSIEKKDDSDPQTKDSPVYEEASIPALGGSIADAIPSLMGLAGPLLSKLGGSHKDNSKNHRRKGICRSTPLLLALKPYLSPSRCETVDRLVQLSKLGELFEKLY